MNLTRNATFLTMPSLRKQVVHDRPDYPITVRRFNGCWVVYGPPPYVMQADPMGDITYCNALKGSAIYLRLLRALRSRTSDSNSPNGEG